MYFTVQTTTYAYQRYDEIQLHQGYMFSAVHLFLSFFTSAILNYQ